MGAERRARKQPSIPVSASARLWTLSTRSSLSSISSSLSLSSQEDVDKLRGSVLIKHTLAERGAEKLWELCSEEPFVPALGALTGGQAVQSVRAGLKAIYCSGKEKEGGRAWGLALSLHLRPLNRNHLSQLA